MQKTYPFYFTLFLLIQISVKAQILNYDKTTSIKTKKIIQQSDFIVPCIERMPKAIAFGENGHLFYTLGRGGRTVTQFELKNNYDISKSGNIKASYYVGNKDEIRLNSIEDLAFSAEGEYMYILDSGINTVMQYKLDIPWNVSSAKYYKKLDVGSHIKNIIGKFTKEKPNLIGMYFSKSQNETENNGKFLFIADKTSNSIFRFDLKKPYDLAKKNISNPSESFDLIYTNSAEGIQFSDDGKRLFVINELGAINTYNFDVEWDFKNHVKNKNATINRGNDDRYTSMLFNHNGTKLFLITSNRKKIESHDLDKSNTFSVKFDDKYFESICLTAEISTVGVAFNDNGKSVFILGTKNDCISEINLPTAFDFTNAEFKRSIYIGGQERKPKNLYFSADGKKLFVLGQASLTEKKSFTKPKIAMYNLKSRYNISSASKIPNQTYDLSQLKFKDARILPTDVSFNKDGSQMYILAHYSDPKNKLHSIIRQFSLATNYDLQSIDISSSENLSLNALKKGKLINVLNSSDMTFNQDGTRLYLSGNTTEKITEITLSKKFQVSSKSAPKITNTFSTKQKELVLNDIVFNTDGSKFFICSNRQGIHTYQTKTSKNK